MKLSFILCKPIEPMILSNFIMDVENTDFSHIAISYGGTVFHAKFPKFKEESWSRFESYYSVVNTYSFNVPENKEDSLFDYLRDQVGKNYSILQLFLIGVGLLSGSLNKYISSVRLNGKKRVICSEAAAQIMIKFFGVNFMESIDTIGLRDVQSMLDALESGDSYGNIWLP